MASKTTEKKGKTGGKSIADISENFVLPESLTCSEVDFPVLLQKSPKCSWKEILQESEDEQKLIEQYVNRNVEPIPKAPFLKTDAGFIMNKVFPELIPALEDTLDKARMWDALKTQKCFFNGIDHIAQVLWNNNRLYPVRKQQNLHVFNIPWVRKYLKENPRHYYPKSWLWPSEYAATIIQKSIRQYFVQREEEVQEMRDFWRRLELERSAPELVTNPLLAKKFASQLVFHPAQQ